MPTWIDFKELRQKLDFKAVLQHYGVELKLKANGNQHQGFCPLSTHDGKKRSPSFSANLEKNIWQCFGCGAKGNVIDFAARMEGLDPKNGDDFRKAALSLHNRFFPGTDRPQKKSESKRVAAAPPENKTEGGQGAASNAPVVKIVNAPLDFELKNLDAQHPYLLGRGFAPETIAHFGLGYCSRGSMQGRIAIPLQNQEGKLIGYAGRLVDDTAVSESQPKYKLPTQRDRNGAVHEFHKSLFLYNGCQITRPTDDLIVVEGFPSVWWLWQAGRHNVVALMGWSCADEQARLIIESVTPLGRIWLMSDGDDAGTRCAESAFAKIAPYRFVRWVKLGQDKQPTHYSREELTTLFAPGGVP